MYARFLLLSSRLSSNANDEEAGQVTDEFRLNPNVFKHATLDLAVMDMSAREERRFFDAMLGGKYA
jgi:hypothetical protein